MYIRGIGDNSWRGKGEVLEWKLSQSYFLHHNAYIKMKWSYFIDSGFSREIDRHFKTDQFL